MPARTWFITGINSGFGRQLAEQLLERGDRVAGTVRRIGSVDDLTKRYGDGLWVGHADVTHTTELRATVDAAFDALGRIDVAVVNAGYGLFGAAEELTDDEIEDEIATNLVGSIQTFRAVIPHLREQGGGRIIQISSVAGMAAHPGASLYHASKWGVEGFAEAMVSELAPFNIGVTIVEPGGARTSFAGSSLRLSSPLAAYAGTPASFVQAFRDGEVQVAGDPAKIAARVIESVDLVPAPRRVVLGSDSYATIMASLTARIAEIEPQKHTAAGTDADAES
jgi:NAD(P)-dependent dehydrogenase (short-subunit alcohol dehydrogenase family)